MISARVALAGVALLVAAGVGPTPAAAAAAPTAEPRVAAGTHLLDHAAAIGGFSDSAWYEANIPFLDVPDQQIQDVYYYRWRTYKEHLRYTDPQHGWTSTEFLDCCGYAAPYQAINAAAGHQITEGRWLRDTTYGDDLVRFWTTGPGAGAKPATESVNPSTTDWAHEYSFWLASAAYGRAQATGDTAQLVALLPALVRQYRGWDGQYDGRLGLYWSVPVWDAMEFSASSYRSSDPYHGGAGFRPTLNSYQYGDAVAISRIAALAGDPTTAAEYARRAASLKAAMTAHLWDPTRDFYFHVARDGNPRDLPLDTREQIGFIPWAFGAAPTGHESAWSQLFDPQGFAAAFGPTTAERRSPLFMHEAANCCRWDGPSWPFATSQTLTAMANLLDDYPAQSVVTPAQYAAQLHTYAATQYKDGKPYVAEAHAPDDPAWIYDGQNHSEDYNHSTYTDLVISGLIGLRPSEGRQLPIKPLVPASWDHFALENVPYHGHNVTVAYDDDGSHYREQGQSIGAGMSVFVDGVRVSHTPTVAPVTVTIPGAPTAAPAPRLVNDAANPLRVGYPKPIASFTSRYDDPWNALDGKVFFAEVPQNTRWTNYASPNPQDWYGVDFGAPTAVGDVRWYGYDDGGGVRPAADYRLQYLAGATWRDVPGQRRESATPVGNGRNRITFPTLTTSGLRLLFTNPPGAFVGVTEFQAWSPSSAALAIDTGGGPTATPTPVVVDGRAAVTVAVRNTTSRAVSGVRLSAAVSPGWRLGPPPPPFSVPPGGVATRTVTVVAPPGAAPGADASLVLTASAPGVSSHRQVDLRTAYPAGPVSPVGSWSLDEGSGSVAHDTAGGHDLTVTGHPAWTPGRVGSALLFDGATSAATAGPVLDTAGNFTVAATVRLDSLGGFQTAVAQDDTTTSGFFLQYSGADGRFAFSTEQGRALADRTPVPGRWYRLVGVHDANAGTYTLYVDGVPQTTVLHLDPGDASAGAFTVGRARAGGNPVDFWHGAVDAVRAWQRALPAAEVSALK